MGMHYGFIAIKCPINKLRESVTRYWSDLEIIESNSNLHGDEVYDWLLAHENPFPEPKPGDSAATYKKRLRNERKLVFWFFKDRQWTVLWDCRHFLTDDERELKKLSAEFGTVLSFLIETTAGCAYFWCFENGKLRRYIGYQDCAIRTKGSPLPEEDGIDISEDFYMQEFEALWRAFGFSLDAKRCQAICVAQRSRKRNSAKNNAGRRK